MRRMSPSKPVTRTPLCASHSARRILDQGVEHRLQVDGRAADDLKNLAGRRLLLQRFGDFGVARLKLLEQPHVLDSDHGLVGEGPQQLDLLLRERAHLGR